LIKKTKRKRFFTSMVYSSSSFVRRCSVRFATLSHQKHWLYSLRSHIQRRGIVGAIGRWLHRALLHAVISLLLLSAMGTSLVTPTRAVLVSHVCTAHNSTPLWALIDTTLWSSNLILNAFLTVGAGRETRKVGANYGAFRRPFLSGIWDPIC